VRSGEKGDSGDDRCNPASAGVPFTPFSDLDVDRDGEGSKEEDYLAQWRLDREKLSGAIELSMVACEGKRKSSNRHGVEPGFKSKFWA
jgi:hypothetical protein